MKATDNIQFSGRLFTLQSGAERVEQEKRPSAILPTETQRDEEKVAPEKILDKIKSLTEDGLYSVRFEKNKEIESLIIKLIDRESGDVIRQIPPEELLGVSKSLSDFRGMVLRTEG